MKLIKPSVEILPQKYDLEGIYRHIEIAGRTCYKSEDNITEGSAKAFVDRMIKNGHRAMLEHGTVYLKQAVGRSSSYVKMDHIYFHETFGYELNHYRENKYSESYRKEIGDFTYLFVTTNLRVLVENDWLEDLEYLCEPTEFHEKRITVKFTCDRGVSHEFVRHRVFSFAQESTRYCNYSKDKFNNELTFIIPSWLKNINEGNYIWDDSNPKLTAGCNIEDVGFDDYSNLTCNNNEVKYSHIDNSSEIDTFFKLLQQCESTYFNLLELKKTPQQARQVLPNALKTELVMTGFKSDWDGFFELRCDKAAHPDARFIANELKRLIDQKDMYEKLDICINNHLEDKNKLVNSLLNSAETTERKEIVLNVINKNQLLPFGTCSSDYPEFISNFIESNSERYNYKYEQIPYMEYINHMLYDECFKEDGSYDKHIDIIFDFVKDNMIIGNTNDW